MASEEIDALNKALTDAFNAGDVEAIAQCYTEDCKFVVTGKVINGHTELKEMWRGFLAEFDQVKLSNENRTISGNSPGDLSGEVGKVSLRKKGTEEWSPGLYCCTYIKGEDGKWRYKYDACLM